MTTQTASLAAAAESTPRQLDEALERQLGASPDFVCVLASPSLPLDTIVAGLAAPGRTVVGASTAGEFTGERETRGGLALIAISSDELRFTAGIGGGLRESPEAAVASALEGQPDAIEGFPYRTGITFLDPLAGNGEEASLLVAERLGDGTPLVGGAAGDDLRMVETRVACGATTRSNAIVVAQVFSRRPLAVGVAHGHRALSGPLRVTRASGATVHEIEGRPAWDVWREVTRARARERGIDVDALPPSEAPGFLLRFEAGLANGEGYKIRAPLSLGEGGSIQFAAAIPEGAVVRVTESDERSQLESARLAAERARAGIEGEVAGAIVFDCICRKLILGDGFEGAVQAMSRALGGAPLAGLETYGEVALSTGEMSAFHNTTSVVLAFPR
ncbi:MAG: FIST C-terminal domain-containing protein [Sandaracinus sp.]